MCRVDQASRKLVQFRAENLLRQRFLVQSKGNRGRDTNVVHSLKDGENLQKILERKVDSDGRGEMMAQRKLYEAEAEVEARNWEKREIPTVLFRRSIKNLSLSDYQASRWADQGQRETRLVCMVNWN